MNKYDKKLHFRLSYLVPHQFCHYANGFYDNEENEQQQ